MTPREFTTRFLETLAPGVLPTAEFIDWRQLTALVDDISDPAGPVQCIRRRVAAGEEPRTAVAETLMGEPEPQQAIEHLFFLIGHTRPVFVTYEYDLDIQKAASRIRLGEQDAAEDVADALFAAGISEVLRASDIADVAMGIRIGLDTHRRKSAGGAAFAMRVDKLLEEVLKDLHAWGISLTKRREHMLSYGDSLRKTVDFALLSGEQPRVVIETNFYTSGGSKPSEVVRAYAELAAKFAMQGIPFVWITDGRGWRDMKNLLPDMQKQVPNVYNTRQAREYLANDLRAFFT